MALPIVTADSTPQELVAGLNAYLDAAEQHLAKREMVELAGLDHVVDALCTRVQTLNIEEGRQFAKPLDALLLRLDHLQQAMSHLQADMKDELNKLTARSKAVRAYKNEAK